MRCAGGWRARPRAPSGGGRGAAPGAGAPWPHRKSAAGGEGGGGVKTIMFPFSRIVFLGLLALAMGGTARAADTENAASKDATFRRGNHAYFNGRHQEAIDAYEQVAALGVVSQDLFYNLGNAYFKAGQMGPAIYNYERALELDPAQEDVRFNLNVAREAVKKKGEDRLTGAEKQPFWMRIGDEVTVNWASWLFL